MRLSLSFAVSAVVSSLSTTTWTSSTSGGFAEAFVPSPAFFSRVATSSADTDTVLYISSWGTKGPPARWADTQENKNPVDNIQSYLKSPVPVESRSNIDGTVLVSGLVRSKERTDQFIFDLLNWEESAFEFSKIVAFVDDEKFAKKRLLSRSARYGGLLDKLEFVQASQAGALPTSEQLDGVKSWVAVLEDGDLIQQIKDVAALAKSSSSVENVSILVTNALALDAAACQSAVDALKDASKQYTLVAVGKLEDHAEGKIPYSYKDFGTSDGVLPADAIFSRDEAMRMITETLQLQSGVGRALSFSEVYDVNATEAKLIKGLREAGYARPQEIDHMLQDGVSVRFCHLCDVLSFRSSLVSRFVLTVYEQNVKMKVASIDTLLVWRFCSKYISNYFCPFFPGINLHRYDVIRFKEIPDRNRWISRE